MSESIDPGPGYRLLSDDEIVRDGDERQDRADREPRPWLRVVCGVGRTVASYRGEFREIGILAVRRRVESEPSELDTLREQVEALTAERDDLRQKLDKAEKMTPERACEIVNQLRQANQLEVRSNTEEWFKPLGPENWQCRPALPKPITLNVTCPPDKREAVEAAIKAAGGTL